MKYLLILFFCLPISLFSQGTSVLYFTKSWTIAELETMKYYKCECFKNEQKQLDGAFNCFTIQDNIIVKTYFFKNNQLHGEVTEYFENGDVKLKAFYNDGLPLGEWKEWDEKGALVVHKTFDKNSKLIKDYFVEENPHDMAVGLGSKKEELPVYGSKCMLTKIEIQRYECSDQLLFKYYTNPPKPPSYQKSHKGQTLITKLKYQLNDRGKVTEAEIIKTCGDVYLDDLAITHVLNMLPFEAAKQYGTPISYWMVADIVFQF